MSAIKLSIVIPCYNASKDIGRLLDSINEQNYDNYEVIIIDDGSIDDSSKLIENYRKTNTRINLIKKINEGVSVARNTGLVNMTGEYVIFIDADDSIDKGFFENVVTNIKQNPADLYLYNYRNVEIFNDDQYPDLIRSPYIGKYSKAEFNNHLLSLNNAYYNYLWNKVFKISIIKENQILFDSNLNYGEDQVFNTKYYNELSSVFYVDDNYYNYYIDVDIESLSTKFNEQFIDNNYKFINSWSNYFNDNKVSELETSNFIKNQYMIRTTIVINSLNSFSKIKELGLLWDYIHNNKIDMVLKKEKVIGITVKVLKFSLMINSIIPLKVYVFSKLSIKKLKRKLR